MLLSIIPIESSIDDEGLTYFAKDELKKDIHIGSLVSIPIRENISYGIVTQILSETQNTANLDLENLRSIVNIACSTPLLAPYQCELTHHLALRHFVHAHKTLALFLPKFIFNALEKKAFEPITWVESRKSKVESRKISFFHNTKNLSLSQYIKNFMEAHPEGVALIFPDDLLLETELQRLDLDAKKITVARNSDTYTRRYKNWLSAYRQISPILAWTRKLLQYNLAGYRHILYIEDSLARHTHSYEHIYKNTEILDIYAKNGFDVTIFSSVPTVESMSKIKTGSYVLI